VPQSLRFFVKTPNFPKKKFFSKSVFLNNSDFRHPAPIFVAQRQKIRPLGVKIGPYDLNALLAAPTDLILA